MIYNFYSGFSCLIVPGQELDDGIDYALWSFERTQSTGHRQSIAIESWPGSRREWFKEREEATEWDAK